MAGPAILSECCICQAPLDICRKGNGDIFPCQVTGEYHFCSDTCRDLAKHGGWEKGMDRSPREMFLEGRKTVIPPCDGCKEAGRKSNQIHTSGVCWNCLTVSCGECISVRRVFNGMKCYKCGSDLLDMKGLRHAYETCNDVPKHRIISRIYGSQLEKKGKQEWADTVIQMAMDLGDLESHYGDLSKYGKPGKEDEDLILNYFYLAVLGHPAAQTTVGRLWEEGLVPGGVSQGSKYKQMFWYDQAGRGGDSIACFNIGMIYKEFKDFPRFLWCLRESGRLGFEEAYHELGVYWKNLGKNDLARENFNKGFDIKPGLCTVQVGIGISSGLYGYEQDIEKGKKIVEKIYEAGKNYEKGTSLYRAYVIARDWLGSVYYNDPSISVTVKGFPEDKDKALDFFMEGLEDNDRICMILLGKILVKRGDVKRGEELMNRAVSLT